MQNQGPPYQGPPGQGSFPDHNYNNQMSPHCPPGGYPSYMNGPYAVGNSRSHHYGNQHLQQGPPPPSQLPYRPNFGPPPGQYIPAPLPPNQELYRNHHPGYVGNSPRTFHGKTGWGESNTGDMMPSYNHGPPHPQMMNSSAPMNVSSMRSPPHIPSAVNPVPSPGSQHYRQMQSPGHSPQTWPQVQVPSPGMHPVARTTPSPLQSHARSPGHGQPFSPSATSHMQTPVNIPSHPIPSVVPENQSTQLVGQSMPGIMPTGPLHSLQKMVMLEQEPNSMQMNCELTNDNNCEPPGQPVYPSNSDEPEDQNSEEETKDSSFATYYNLDENRLESKPQTASAFKDSNYSMDVKEVSHSPQSLISNSDDPSSDNHLSETGMQGPQSYSVPAVAGNDECNSAVDMPNGTSHSSENESVPKDLPKLEDTSVKLEAEDNSVSISDGEVSDSSKKDENLKCQNEADSVMEDTTTTAAATTVTMETSNVNDDNSVEKTDINNQEVVDEEPVPEISIPNHKEAPEVAVNCEKSQSEEHIVSEQISEEEGEVKVCQEDVELTVPVSTTSMSKSKLITVNSKTVCQTVTTGRVSGSATITTAETVSYNPNKMINIGKTKVSASEIARNPVKVVIHRIRTNSTNDTWHVPNSNGNAVVETNDNGASMPAPCDGGDKTDGETPRTSKIGPQIIILSPAMSKKKFGTLNSSGNQKTVVSVKTEKIDSDVADSPASSSNSQPATRNTKKGRRSGGSAPARRTPNSVAKKKGRAPSAASKARTPKRKRKGKQKDTKRKKPEQLSSSEAPPKPKKLKPFAGPYIRLTGSRASPSSITIVNMAIREEEKGKPLRLKAAESTGKRPKVGHTSTLSPHYDAFNKDRTWLCAFCHKGSHCNGLGDLYGPYYVKFDATLPIESDNSPCSSRGIRSKRRKSDASLTEGAKTLQARKSSKQASKLAEHQESAETIQKLTEQSSLSTNGEPAAKEVWIHEDCAVWCQSISLMGSQICGLEEAIEEACKNICSSCKLSGATLGCWCKGCTEQYHFICAKEKGCKLNIENFSLFCSKHKDVKYLSKDNTS